MRAIGAPLGAFVLLTAILAVAMVGVCSVTQTVDAKSKTGGHTPPACSHGSTVLKKNKHCLAKIHLAVQGTEVVIGFRLIKVPDEEFVGMANLKGGESHDFVVNSGSYQIFVIPGNGTANSRQIDDASGDCNKVSVLLPGGPVTAAQLSVGPGETKNCNLLLGPVAGGIGIGLPGGGSVGSVISLAVSV